MHLAVLAMVLLVLLPAAPALAACDPDSDFCVIVTWPPVNPDSPPPPVDDNDDDPVGMFRWYAPRVVLEGGISCWTVEFIRWDPDPPPPESTYAGALATVASYHQNGRLVDACPSIITDTIGGAPGSAWAAVVLPDPALEVDPGYAVAGVRSYLEVTQGDPSDPAPVPTIFGDLVIEVSDADYELRWCATCATQYPTSKGGPYPDGDVTWVYTSAGDVTITWTSTWTASWSVGTVGPFDLGARSTTAAIPLEVESRQAVVDG